MNSTLCRVIYESPGDFRLYVNSHASACLDCTCGPLGQFESVALWAEHSVPESDLLVNKLMKIIIMHSFWRCLPGSFFKSEPFLSAGTGGEESKNKPGTLSLVTPRLVFMLAADRSGEVNDGLIEIQYLCQMQLSFMCLPLHWLSQPQHSQGKRVFYDCHMITRE